VSRAPAAGRRIAAGACRAGAVYRERIPRVHMTGGYPPARVIAWKQVLACRRSLFRCDSKAAPQYFPAAFRAPAKGGQKPELPQGGQDGQTQAGKYVRAPPAKLRKVSPTALLQALRPYHGRKAPVSAPSRHPPYGEPVLCLTAVPRAHRRYL
jgi:hypothetical protein